MKLNPDVPLPRSFALSTLLLLTTIVALSICLASSRIALNREQRAVLILRDQLGFIRVVDRNQIYVKNLNSYEFSTFAFRVFLPAGKKYILKVGEGTIDPATGHPPCFASSEISDVGEQGIIAFYLGTLTLRSKFKGFPKTEVKPESLGDSGDPDRFRWVKHTLEIYEDDNVNRATPREFNPDNSVVLLEFSQLDTFNRALAPPVGVNRNNARTLKIWIEPVPATSSTQE